MNTPVSRRRFVQASLAVPFLVSSFASLADEVPPALKVAGFADEISPELDEQIRVCRKLGVRYIELRAAARRSVLSFDDALRHEVRTKLRDNGMGVASIGSPIGKVAITSSWTAHFDSFKRAVEMAEFFSAPLIRLFSYYPAKGEPFPKHRDEVMRRMQLKTEYVKDHPVTLVHENEARIYGEKGPECLDILKTINSPKLRCAFDFANFIQAGDDPRKNWELLKPYVAHFHIKDCKKDTKKVVPAGEGDGSLQAILQDAYQSGYRGFLSLEPHLQGAPGPVLFERAADALRVVCRKACIPLG